MLVERQAQRKNFGLSKPWALSRGVDRWQQLSTALDALGGAWEDAQEFMLVTAQPCALFNGSGEQRQDVPLDSGFILLFMCMSKKNLWGADC